MDEFAEALSHARTTAALGKVTTEVANRCIGHSGVSFLRISGPIVSPEDLFALGSRGQSAPLPEMIHLIDRELESQYGSKLRVFDIAERYPPDVVRRSRVYNEYWRPLDVERQLVAFLGTVEAPIGYICVARSAKESAFIQRDLDTLADMRVVVERALAATRQLGFGTLEDDLLTVLARGMPGPWLLFSAAGKLLWLTEEAHSRLWPDVGQVGNSICRAIARRVLPRRDEALEQLRTWVRAEARALPGRVAVPGGQLVLRRFETKSGTLFLIGLGAALAPDTVRRAERLARVHSLTARQAEVLIHLASGKTNKGIAALIGRAENTVELHVTALFAKFGCENRAELVARFWTA